MSSITNNPPAYQIVGYQENSVSAHLEIGPGPWDSSESSSYANHGRRITTPESIGPRLRGTVMAANQIFRDRGAALAYPFLLSSDMSSSEILPTGMEVRFIRDGMNCHYGRAPDGRHNTADMPLLTTNHLYFVVGDVPMISAPNHPFSILQGYDLYNRLTLANRMYLHNVLSINSIGLGEYILQKIRTLPTGPERQELVMCMVYLLSNGFFTSALLHERYSDIEPTILNAQREGCLHRDILPMPHVRAMMNGTGRQGMTGEIPREVTHYPPITDHIPQEIPGIQRVGPGNCRYLPEIFRANTLSQMMYDPSHVPTFVGDEEVAANLASTERVLAKIRSESE